MLLSIEEFCLLSQLPSSYALSRRNVLEAAMKVYKNPTCDIMTMNKVLGELVIKKYAERTRDFFFKKTATGSNVYKLTYQDLKLIVDQLVPKE